MWPTGLGFDRYYGFLNGETNQWTPNLVRDTNHVEPPREPADGYHLDADLADNAIAYLRELRISHPERPFLLWYASAAPHAPHQAPPEWIDRFRGQFDDGWDAWRDATLARQIELGILPDGTQLSDRPPWIEEWSTIDAPRRRLYARMMEVFAAFIAHADHQIGRVLDHLAATGDLDNTVVVFVSDNGTSGEGGPNGTYNQLGHYISDEPDDIDDELAHIDDLGGFRSSGHYPWGWALAGNTPFRRWKRYTFEGGVRDPFILAGPGVTDAGGVRDQYCHATDVLPTVLELCGIALPDELDGIEQMSYDGASLGPVVADATAPEVHTDASTTSAGAAARCTTTAGRPSPITSTSSPPPNANRSPAATTSRPTRGRSSTRAPIRPSRTTSPPTNRERLADLVARWYAAAEQNQVFPLDDGAVNRITHMHVPWTASRTSFRYVAGDKVHEVAGPNIAGGFRMVATFDGPLPTATPAVLCEQGDWISGWAWYLADGEARWCIAGKGGTHTVAAPVPPSTRVLVARRRARRRRARGHARRRRRRDRTREPRRASAARVGARRRVPHHRLRPPVPGQRRLHATRARATLAHRRHDPGRTTPALRPRRRARAHPAPPIGPHSIHTSIQGTEQPDRTGTCIPQSRRAASPDRRRGGVRVRRIRRAPVRCRDDSRDGNRLAFVRRRMRSHGRGVPYRQSTLRVFSCDQSMILRSFSRVACFWASEPMRVSWRWVTPLAA